MEVFPRLSAIFAMPNRARVGQTHSKHNIVVTRKSRQALGVVGSCDASASHDGEIP